MASNSEPKRRGSRLREELILCQKNPGYKDFIHFNIGHLPNRYRDIEMLNFIRAMANLTVYVCGGYTSEKRPKTWAGIDILYPLYTQLDVKYLKTGTGMVWDVMNFTDEFREEHGIEERNCGCTQCRNSPTPMTQWFKVEVMTAKNIVFDEVEAQHTKCQLFYDRDEEKNKIREIKGETVRAIDENIEGDRCMITCYIHDLELGKKLEDMLEVFQALYRNVCDKYMNHVIEHPLIVIVSHPHGHSKLVSIEEMIKKEKMDLYDETCSGGGPVFVAGQHSFGLHHHIESCGNHLNMSGIMVEFT